MSNLENLEKQLLALERENKRLRQQIESLAKNRDELQEIFTLSLDLLCIADINTMHFVKVNPAVVNKLGYAEEELLSRSFLDFVYPDDVDATIRVVEEELKVGTNVINFTNRFKRSDGTYLWLDWVSHPMPERGVAFAAAHDITKLKQTEQELLESQGYIRNVMDNLPLGIAVNSVEPVVNFKYMNDNFPKFYRTTRQALADPNNFWEAVYEDPDFREQMKKRVLEDCATGRAERMSWEDVPIARKGKETRYISAMNTPIPEKGLMISTVWDVTSRKQAEEDRQKLQEQLASAQKMESVGRLAGGVAHDFNNMLSVILGHAEIALDALPDDYPERSSLEEIHKAALRSVKLTQQLLAFARKQTVAPKVLELNTVVVGMLDMLRRLIGENITLTWEPEEGLWAVKMDPGQVDQILANLCVNARDAITSVGTITIKARNISGLNGDGFSSLDIPSGDYVLLTIADSGSGMKKEVIEHLFDPFFTTKDTGEGTGLGLSTVYGIVKQNRGHINVSSEPGKGSVFRIYLPRYFGYSVAENEESQTGNLMKSTARETILLVEDEAANLKVYSAMLRKLDYQVLAAASPAEAIKLAENTDNRIDMVISDVIMPEMNGWELVKKLLVISPAIKLLFMSGYTADVIANHGSIEEGVNFIQKPFSKKDFAEKVREVLDS